MNLPSHPEAGAQGEVDPAAQYKRLRVLAQATAVSVLILTGTLFVFLYRQVVLVRRQTGELARYIAEVQQSGMPQFEEQVRAKLNEFRKQQPDFNPIYIRYFGTNEPAPSKTVTGIPGGMTNKH